MKRLISGRASEGSERQILVGAGRPPQGPVRGEACPGARLRENVLSSDVRSRRPADRSDDAHEHLNRLHPLSSPPESFLSQEGAPARLGKSQKPKKWPSRLWHGESERIPALQARDQGQGGGRQPVRSSESRHRRGIFQAAQLKKKLGIESDILTELAEIRR